MKKKLVELSVDGDGDGDEEEEDAGWCSIIQLAKSVAVIVVNLGLPRFPAFPSFPAEVDRANSDLITLLFFLCQWCSPGMTSKLACGHCSQSRASFILSQKAC